MNAEAKTEVSHTPGPWGVSSYGAGQRVIVPGRAGFNGRPYQIADAHFSDSLANTATAKEAAANAWLIAAAPDLLSALKLCAARLEMSRQELLILNEANGTRDDVQNETADEGDKNAIEIARAAIGQAEGRAS